MSELNGTLASVLSDRYAANFARVREVAASLSEKQFWIKPFPHGNSFGHLILHLTGNLNYYIGSQIANTGYVRDRQREFSESNPPSKEEALNNLGNAIAMVVEAIHTQSSEDWTKPYVAVGTNCANRLDIVVQCAAHMQHHIGQMLYLVSEFQRKAEG